MHKRRQLTSCRARTLIRSSMVPCSGNFMTTYTAACTVHGLCHVSDSFGTESAPQGKATGVQTRASTSPLSSHKQLCYVK